MSHGFLVTREYFATHKEIMGGLVVLSNVDTDRIRSGDHMDIDLADDGNAVLTVKRFPKKKHKKF
ncbi:hypothetical protein HY357_03125 [Candidatus Roizmanbacteria bacterium]|nr:hypothetical protein [Candidatus Roizmanbacteria bacterium]